jgi:hypothetical protein
VQKVLVTNDEEGDEWEEEEDYGTFVVAKRHKRNRESAMFLSSDEILLDNQASQCIFHNERLLHSVVDRPLQNVQDRRGSVRTACRPDWEDTGFGRIGASVGLAENASANILAQARLIDAGYRVRYDSNLDQYEVETDSVPMTFTRK